jgi:GntR family transcriptional repressor for pyruvate dehydrogenase complex
MDDIKSYLSKQIGNNGSLVNQVIEQIKVALIKKELKPGEYLPSEEVLSKNFGVGKSSIREAIKMLQAMGVVEVRRGQGTIVCESIKEDSLNPIVFQLIIAGGNTDDIIDLRMIFEPAYSIMAMKRATKQDVEDIKATIDHFEKLIKQGTQTAQDDIDFHLAILKATHNPFVELIGNTILQLFKASIERSMEQIPELALHDHRKIFDAFISGDENKLTQSIYASFEGWESSLFSTFGEDK